MPSTIRSLTALFVSAALIAAPTEAVAAQAQAQASVTQPTSGWLTLSMLNPSGAAVLHSTAVAAAQPEAPPPPPPPGSDDQGKWALGFTALMLLLVAIFALTNHDHHHHPNSPA